MLIVRDLYRPGLAAVSFEMRRGECVALRGPSGAGKSLLLRAIADLDPNTGTAVLDGHPRERMPAPAWRRLVTYVPAESGWWADQVGRHFRDWTTAEPFVTALGLPASCREWPIARLSTGERQRLALARSFAQRPRVLLLDEPTASLDPEATIKVEALVAQALADGAAALWVTHDPGQAKRVAGREAWIVDGQLRLAA